MTDAIVLNATKRDVIGKSVRHLRHDGVIPGVLYGPEFDPINVQMDWPELRVALRAAGASAIIQLDIEGDTTYPALVRDVQRAPLRGDVLHVDFYRVRMDVAIRTEVPIVTVGEAEKITEQGAVVIQELNSIMVECLPLNLPAQIEIDIDGLTEVGDLILVSGLPELEGVQYLSDPDILVIATSYAAAQVAEEVEEGMEAVDQSAEPELIRPDREEDEE